MAFYRFKLIGMANGQPPTGGGPTMSQILTNENKDIGGHNLINAFGNAIPFPPTVVIDENGEVVTDAMA